MTIINLLEIFFVFSAGMAMPFIVIGSYFGLVPQGNRNKPLAICFLIISIIYALIYLYFSWQVLKNSANWKRITA